MQETQGDPWLISNMLRAIASLYLDIFTAGMVPPDCMLHSMVIYRKDSIRLLDIGDPRDGNRRHSQIAASDLGTASVITFNQLHDEMVALLEPMDGIIGLHMKNIAERVKSNFQHRRWSWASVEDRQNFSDEYSTLVACAPRQQGLDPSEPTPLPKVKQSPTETKNVPVLLKTSMARLRDRPPAEKRRPPYVKTWKPSAPMHPSAEAPSNFATDEYTCAGDLRGPPGLPHPPVHPRVKAERLHGEYQTRSTQVDSGGVHGHGILSKNTLTGILLCLYACHKVLQGLHAQRSESDGMNMAKPQEHHESQGVRQEYVQTRMEEWVQNHTDRAQEHFKRLKMKDFSDPLDEKDMKNMFMLTRHLMNDIRAQSRRTVPEHHGPTAEEAAGTTLDEAAVRLLQAHLFDDIARDHEEDRVFPYVGSIRSLRFRCPR